MEEILKIIEIQAVNLNLSHWACRRYMPTPTIIQGASGLYVNHSVEKITRTEASGESSKRGSDFVMNVIDYSPGNRQKSIFFVSGVPGAEKMLAGVKIVVH